MADTDPSLYNLRYNQLTSNLEAFGGGSPQWTLVTLDNVNPTQVPVTRQINTTAPLVGGGNLTADRTISIPQATSTVDGYLLHTDWTTFNNKLDPTLMSGNLFVGNGSNVAAGVALSGDATITNAGVLSLANVNSNVGSFTLANITVDAKGRITAASSGSASGITQLTGDVTAGPGAGSQVATLATVNSNVGSFTNASLTVNGKGLITAASNGTAPVTSVSGTAGDISSTGGTTPVLDLVNTAVTPASYTNTSLTVDAKGRITAASSGTAAVTSVSGTTNQIASTGGTTPTLSLSTTLVFPGTATGTLTGHSTLDLALAGGTMSGAIAMGANKITGLANGTASTDAMAFGQNKVIQIVSMTTTTATTTTSGSYTGTNVSLSITPTSSSNKIMALTFGGIRASGTATNNSASYTLTRGGTDVTGGNEMGRTTLQVSGTTEDGSVVIAYIDSPATTSATTYAVAIRSGNASDTISYPIGGTTAGIILMEVVA